MRRTAFSILLIALLLPVLKVEAQVPGQPGMEAVTVAVHGGGFWPSADVGDGAFGSAGAVGGTVGLWLSGFVDEGGPLADVVGFRGSLLFAEPWATGDVPDPLAGTQPQIWLLNADLVLRWPVDIGPAGWLIPYALGGAGIKVYDFFDQPDTHSDLSGNIGAGAEYRFTNRLGILTEFRTFVSDYERFGVSDTQYDLVWTAGVYVSF